MAIAVMPGAGAGSEHSVEGVERLEREWLRALVAHDAEALDKIWADDYWMTLPEARVSRRPTVSPVFATGPSPATSWLLTNPESASTRTPRWSRAARASRVASRQTTSTLSSATPRCTPGGAIDGCWWRR